MVVIILLLAHVGIILLLVEHLYQTKPQHEPFAFVGGIVLIGVLCSTFYFLTTLLEL